MKKTFLALVAVVSLASLAKADSACTGSYTLVSNPTATDASTMDATGSFGGNNGCTIGGYDFSNFTVTPNDGFTSQSLVVTFNTDGNGFYLGITQGTGQDVIVTYDVSPGPPGMILSLLIPSVGVGAGSSNETVCTVAGSGFSSSCGGVLGSGGVNDTGTMNILTYVIPVAPNSGTDYISKDISGTSEIFQAAAPEPMTLSLMGAGLLGLGILGRRRLKK